eukprot:1827302-Rhodomonas_salina.1
MCDGHCKEAFEALTEEWGCCLTRLKEADPALDMLIEVLSMLVCCISCCFGMQSVVLRACFE